MKVVKILDDCWELQRDTDKIYEWSKRWKLDFNVKKCHVMEQKQKKAKIRLQDGTGSNTEDQGGKRSGCGDTR